MTTVFTSDATQPAGLGAMTGSAGPSYCDTCGEWPASMTPKGKRCHLCWTRDIAAENPVPLPSDTKMLEDLASLGVTGAAEKLRQNDEMRDSAGSAARNQK